MHLPATLKTVFSFAFRPFFMLVAGYAIVSIAAWGLYQSGLSHWPDVIPPHLRHGHEMLFGFAGGAIAGFLLTAVATWTNRPAVSGLPLLVLCAAWILARLGAYMPGASGFALWALASLTFWFGLTALMVREVIAARNARNYKVPVLLTGFLATEISFFLYAPNATDQMETSLRVGVFLVIGMILLVGGRIIPAFTQNWLRLNKPHLPVCVPGFDQFDLATTLITLGFAIGFVLWPAATVTGCLGILSGIAQSLRLVRWRGWLAWQEPLLWVLHVGYVWIPVGFCVLGIGILRGSGPLFDKGIHALTYGAMGTLILGVAARVALGHTGRLLQAFPSMRGAFFLITAGALIRTSADLGTGWTMAAGMLWMGAYLIFLVRYAPILLSPRTLVRP